jgi:hypothetical protein
MKEQHRPKRRTCHQSVPPTRQGKPNTRTHQPQNSPYHFTNPEVFIQNGGLLDGGEHGAGYGLLYLGVDDELVEEKES